MSVPTHPTAFELLSIGGHYKGDSVGGLWKSLYTTDAPYLLCRGDRARTCIT